MDEYGVDLEEITRVIDHADVMIARFQSVQNRLLVDFRTSEQDGPLVAAVPPVSSIEERFSGLKSMRPGFPLPERILSFLWPRSVETFVQAGLLTHLRERLLAVGGESMEAALASTFRQMLQEERSTIRAAILGGEGFQTLWERRD